ncbi:hypothetical protein [Spiroplasma cantharicola]|uniref:Uncharacterized protein n=1 Tax=Spiroplasma cantharicola TaxID=362837 RepID=A0A0M4K1U9_9MOLU|nr:hypothetical protein [Spiroplasma cantharicola]ALD66637.1 hypothetical protein SCANT_v1c07310 [Spiroplasma cantharicola]
MFYRNNDFWNEKGAEYISSYLKLINIDNSKEEIFELLAENDYSEEEMLEDFDIEFLNHIKAWEVIRKMVLKVREFEEKYAKRFDELILDELVEIYEYLDPSKEYSYMFQGKTTESKDFLNKLKKIISKLTIVETFDSVLEYLLAAAFDLTSHQFLGKKTFLYFFWLFQAAMISRNHGIAVFEEKFELDRIMELKDEIVIYARQNNSRNFSYCAEFREFVALCRDKIDIFSNYERHKYE